MEVHLNADNTDGIQILGNVFSQNRKSGIYLRTEGAGGLKQAMIQGNICRQHGDTGSANDNNLRVDMNTTEPLITDNPFYSNLFPVQNVRFWTGRTHNNLTVRGDKVVAVGGTTAWTEAGTYTACRIVGSDGYNPQGPAAITVGATPYTYTAGKTPEVVYIDGGTRSAVVKSGTTLLHLRDARSQCHPTRP